MSITRVQSQSGGIDAAGLTITCGANFTAGNLIVVSISLWNLNNTTVTIGGLTATKVIERDAGGGDFCQQFYVIATGGISGASTVIIPNTSNYYEASVVEYSSTTGWPADPITASGVAAASAVGTSSAPSASITTTAADCVIVSNWSNSGTGDGDNGTPPATGYTRDYTAVASEGGAGGSKIVTSAGLQSATHSVANSIPWACLIAAYAANTGGGGGASPPGNRRLLLGVGF